MGGLDGDTRSGAEKDCLREPVALYRSAGLSSRLDRDGPLWAGEWLDHAEGVLPCLLAFEKSMDWLSGLMTIAVGTR